MRKTDCKILKEKQESERSRFQGLVKTLSRIAELHPCDDDRIRDVAKGAVRYLKYGLEPLAKSGRTLAEVRDIIVRRYALYRRSLEEEGRKQPTLARFERVCLILRDAILQSVKARDISFQFSGCYLAGLYLLADGVIHKTKVGVGMGDRPSISEQHRMVKSMKLVGVAHDCFREAFGVTVIGGWESLFKMSGLEESLKGLPDDELYHRFLFRGNSDQVIFNPEGFRDEIERQECFYKQLSVLRDLFCPTLSLKLTDILNADELYDLLLFTMPESRETFSNPIQCLRDIEEAANRGTAKLIMVDGKRVWERICADEKKLWVASTVLKPRSTNPEDVKLWEEHKKKIQVLRQQKTLLLNGLNEAGVALKDLDISLPAVTIDLDHRLVTLPDGNTEQFYKSSHFPIIVLLLVSFRPDIQPNQLYERMCEMANVRRDTCKTDWWNIDLGKLSGDAVRDKLRDIRDELEKDHLQRLFGEDCRMVPNTKDDIYANWPEYFRVKWRKDGEIFEDFPYEEYPEKIGAALK